MSDPTQSIAFELTANADQFTRTMDNAGKKLDELVSRSQKTAAKLESNNASTADSYFQVVDHLKMAAAAVDSLGARTDALTGKQHTAWTEIASVVGGATGGMIEKVMRFADAAQKAADNAEAGFSKIGKSMWESTDALQVANDRLADVNAKLANRSPNYLKLELDEARLASDKLADSLASDQQKASVLLSQNHQSWWHTLLHQGSTNNLEGTIGSMQQQIADAGDQQQIDLHRGDTAAAGKDRQKIDSGEAYLAKKLTDVISVIDHDAAAHKGPDRQAERAIAVGALAQTTRRQDDVSAQDTAKAEEAQNRQETDAKEAEEKAKAAASAAAEARRQAAEKQFAAMENVLNRRKAMEQLSAADEAAYWEAQLGPAQKYSENVDKVYARLGSAQQTYYREVDASIAKAWEQYNHEKLVMQEQLRTLEELDKQWAEALHRDADAKAALAEVNLGNSNGMAELITSHEAATGAITKYDAAVQMASLHASTYAAQLAAITKEKANDDADTSLSTDQRKANQDQRDVKAAQIQGEADRTAQQDRWNEFYTTGLGGATAALEQFEASARDSSAQMREFVSNTIKGLNDTLLKGLSTRHEHWGSDLGNYGAGLAKNVGEVTLNKGEGALMAPLTKFLESQGEGGKSIEQMLGLDKDSKKPVGTASDPLYVKMAGDAGGAANPLQDIHAAMGKVKDLANLTKPAPVSPDLMAALGGQGQSSQDLGQMLFAGSGFGGGDDDSAPADSAPSRTSMPIPASGFGKIMGSLLGNVSSFAGFFADGGDFPGDSSAIVGERGPELVHFGRSGHVTPNNELGDALGSGGFQHIGDVHVDARGSGDRAGVEAAAHRGYTRAVQDSMAGMQHAQAEQSRRTPGMVKR